MTTMTIELRNPDGSTMATLRFFQADETWHDLNVDNSPLNVTQGRVDDTAYGQFRCMDNGTEVLRLVNIDWTAPATRSGAAFCYGCKIGYTQNPTWYCTDVQ
jgi:hypothetical protein